MEDLNDLFTSAAWAVKHEGWDFEVDDMVQELWLWYVEKPFAREKLKNWQQWPKAKGYVKIYARGIAGDMGWSDKKFRAQYDYSVDTVKDILKGKIGSDKTDRDLRVGLERLKERHKPYFDVLNRVYGNGEAEKDTKLLTRARDALTDEMNFALAEPPEGADEPGKTLGDGLGRPKLTPPPIHVEQEEPVPVRGYYSKRKEAPPKKPRRFPAPKSLEDLQYKGEPYKPNWYTNVEKEADDSQ